MKAEAKAEAMMDARRPSHGSGVGRGNEPIPARRAARVLLASRSPRRRDLLASAGIAHEVIDSGVDDAHLQPGAVAADQWVAALAYLKAAAAASKRAETRPHTGSAEPAVIIGADTIVLDDGQIIGQPRDAADAERILRRLINGSHSVLTGVAMLDAATGRREIFTDRAEVTVGEVSDDAVAAYLRSGAWQGKAGAYNLAERLAAGWPIRFEGDPGTIMGLPMRQLVSRLDAFGRS
ncbi:MAG: septum formation protein Maf [Phycisphaerales bacterium]|nr:septum formation protein Maf [Phycisphaerales bacterium]